MKVYNLFEITCYSSEIYIFCTDGDALEWVSNEIKKLLPSCKLTITDISGFRYRLIAEKLQDKGSAVSWYIAQLLGQNGWEPFAHAYSPGKSTYSFRLET